MAALPATGDRGEPLAALLAAGERLVAATAVLLRKGAGAGARLFGAALRLPLFATRAALLAAGRFICLLRLAGIRVGTDKEHNVSTRPYKNHITGRRPAGVLWISFSRAGKACNHIALLHQGVAGSLITWWPVAVAVARQSEHCVSARSISNLLPVPNSLSHQVQHGCLPAL